MPFKDPIKKKEYQRQYYRKNSEKIKERTKKWQKENREKYIEWKREWNRKNKDKSHQYYLKMKEEHPEKLKELWTKFNRSPSHKISHLHWRNKLQLEVFYHYSNSTMRCACCGESIFDFLELDHKNNDGWKDKKRGLKSARLWAWLRKNNFPEGYQILCANCNRGKLRNNGICPHQTLDIS